MDQKSHFIFQEKYTLYSLDPIKVAHYHSLEAEWLNYSFLKEIVFWRLKLQINCRMTSLCESRWPLSKLYNSKRNIKTACTIFWASFSNLKRLVMNWAYHILWSAISSVFRSIRLCPLRPITLNPLRNKLSPHICEEQSIWYHL